jgi:hypothetical protein
MLQQKQTEMNNFVIKNACLERGTLYPQKVGDHFAGERRSLGRYSSLADSDHGV